MTASKRTSLIVDPPDGRLPPLTPQGRKAAELRAASDRNDQLGRPRADSYTDRPLADRCLVGFNAGPPMTPGAYNNNVQTLSNGWTRRDSQRDGPRRTHRPARRASASPATSASVERRLAGALGGRYARRRHHKLSPRNEPERVHREHASGRTLHAHRRRHAPLRIHRRRSDDVDETVDGCRAHEEDAGPLFEYACHEGNYAMFNILSGARASEKAGTSTGQK